MPSTHVTLNPGIRNEEMQVPGATRICPPWTDQVCNYFSLIIHMEYYTTIYSNKHACWLIKKEKRKKERKKRELYRVKQGR